MSTMQLPWEWVENSQPQQVLDNVSFSVKSGQMLAIMGNSGLYCRVVFFVILKCIWKFRLLHIFANSIVLFECRGR